MAVPGMFGAQRRQRDASPPPDVVARLMAAFNEGLADTAGAPVDLVNGALRWGGVPVSNEPIGGSANLSGLLHQAGIGQLGQSYAPQSDTERYGQSIARSLGQAALPAGATLGIGGKLAALPHMVADAGVGNALRWAAIDAALDPGRMVLADGGSAVGSGIGGQAAREITRLPLPIPIACFRMPS